MPDKKTKQNGTRSRPSPRKDLRAVRKWSFAAELLELHEQMAVHVSDSKLTPSDFWNVLETVDTISVVRNRLERSEVEKTPRSLWGPFLAQYTAACITGLARKVGVLDPLERSGLVIFPFAGSGNPLRDIKPKTFKPDPDDNSDDLPALVPVARDIPFFSADFLGLFQSRLDWLIANKRLFPRPEGEITDITTLMKMTHESMKPARLYHETYTAIAQYLQLCQFKKDPARIDDIASTGAPFVFLWLTRLRLLDDIIDGLLLGSPIMKKPEDPKSVFGFQRADEGMRAGFFRIESEKE